MPAAKPPAGPPGPRSKRAPIKKPRGAAAAVAPSRRPKTRRQTQRMADRPGVTRARKKTPEALKYAMRLFKDQYSHAQRNQMLMQRYGIAERTADEWIAESLEIMKASRPPSEDQIRELREQTRVGLDETYRDAKADKDHSASVAALRERSRLYSLHAPLEVTVGGKGPGGAIALDVTATIIDLRTTDMRGELAALTAKARALDPTAAPPEVEQLGAEPAPAAEPAPYAPAPLLDDGAEPEVDAGGNA